MVEHRALSLQTVHLRGECVGKDIVTIHHDNHKEYIPGVRIRIRIRISTSSSTSHALLLILISLLLHKNSVKGKI